MTRLSLLQRIQQMLLGFIDCYQRNFWRIIEIKVEINYNDGHKCISFHHHISNIWIWMFLPEMKIISNDNSVYS